jgi:tryptophan-rich sensory protein
MAIRLVIFLFLNFGALAIGVTLMGDGASSDWYLQLNKAPWTPPGWSFGVAWTVIMIGFAIYMSYAF